MIVAKLEQRRDQERIMSIRCSQCQRWPWQMRVVRSVDDDCPECVRLRQSNPDPFGQSVVMVIDPNRVLD